MQHRAATQNSRGFTLIEAMIVVAVIGIIVAIAFPSFTEYMRKARRVDAMSLLQEAAGEQVRYFSDNNRYAKDMQELGYGAVAAITAEGYYTVTTSYPNAPLTSSFVLTAKPVTGGLQEKDTLCESMTINSNGVKGATGKLGTDCW